MKKSVTKQIENRLERLGKEYGALQIALETIAALNNFPVDTPEAFRAAAVAHPVAVKLVEALETFNWQAA